MKSINKRIKEEGLEVRYIWDKPSVNGFPTKDSLVLTYVIKDVSNISKEYFSADIGIALKVPNDEPIQRIGKAIAYRHLNELPYSVESVSNVNLLCCTEDYFEFINKRLCKEYKERVKLLFMEEFVYTFIEDVEL